MKVILSRKGFDSGFGGIASPILPDGTLLSMPIPTDDVINYNDLRYNGKKYSDILKELKPTFKYKTCHLDPDIKKDCKAREDNWVSAFGQSDAALSHLNNHHVDEGDLFLYFGWFRQTEYDSNGKLRFVPGAPDLQVIYGYLQVGKVCRTWDEIKKVSWHPHADVRCENLKHNAIYIANDKFLDTELEGYGVLNFSKDLVLTKEGESRSKWQLPTCLIDKEISYHSLSNYKDGYFQSARRGQEFVVDADNAIIDWVKNLIIKHKA